MNPEMLNNFNEFDEKVLRKRKRNQAGMKNILYLVLGS